MRSRTVRRPEWSTCKVTTTASPVLGSRSKPMSSVLGRWNPHGTCVRHDEQACVSCLTYDNGDLRAEIKNMDRAFKVLSEEFDCLMRDYKDLQAKTTSVVEGCTCDFCNWRVP